MMKKYQQKKEKTEEKSTLGFNGGAHENTSQTEIVDLKHAEVCTKIIIYNEN